MRRDAIAYGEHVTARNTEQDSPNPMHNDQGAAQFGFAGALVPGNTTYAYIADALDRALGEGWDEHARIVARFTAPVYDGDDLSLEFEQIRADDYSALRIIVAKSDGTICVRGTAELLGAEVEVPSASEYPATSLPESPRLFAEEEVLDHELLGTVEFEVDEADQRIMLARIGSQRGEERSAAHSAWLAKWYWPLVSRNWQRDGAGVHVCSDLSHFRRVCFGERISLRGRFEALYGRRGSRYYEIKMGFIDSDERVVIVTRHTSIYRLVPKGRA